MASEAAEPVDLYVYDLTHGIASLLSPAILGQQIEGVWHTAVVVYGREYFFGGDGITSCAPGSTQLGAPLRVERLGETFVPAQLLRDYMQGLADTSYTPASYNLLEHNCNHFSDEVAQFLCGARLPKHILELPERVLSPALRASLQTMLGQLLPRQHQSALGGGGGGGLRHSRQDSPDYLTLNTQIEEARQQSQALEERRSTLAEKLARKERKKEKKRKKHLRENGGVELDIDMAEAVEAPRTAELGAPHAGPSAQHDDAAAEAEEQRAHDERKKNREQPVVFRDLDGAQEFEKLSAGLAQVPLSPEEQNSLDELRQYLVQGEGSWVLGDDFLTLIGRLLNDAAVPVETRASALRCLAACALRDDVSLLLHQDRRDHTLVNYAVRIDRLEPPEQEGVALFMCNLFENISSSEWLLYISEWQTGEGAPLSNIRCSTKVAVHALLSERPALAALGAALMHNIATKERFQSGKALRDLLPRHAKSKVFDDVCVELAMALLQFLGGAPSEEPLYLALRALARLAQHSPEVPQLIAMLGLQPASFRGTSTRVDEQIDIIAKKMK